MAEKLLQHKHCGICGKAIPSEESFCSEECKREYTSIVRKRRLMMYVFYGLIFIFIIIFLIGVVK